MMSRQRKPCSKMMTNKTRFENHLIIQQFYFYGFLFTFKIDAIFGAHRFRNNVNQCFVGIINETPNNRKHVRVIRLK